MAFTRVRLLEPSMCNDCSFAKVATVNNSDGKQARMLHCTRKDCDNWEHEDQRGVITLEVRDHDTTMD
jgi:hypothetical protein